MRAGGCAGFGKTPNARTRRLLARVLYAGGFAVAGSVAFAVTASAAQADQPSESEGLLSTLTSTVEPLTSVVEPVTGTADSLVGEAETLTGDLLGGKASPGDDTLLADAATLVQEPVTAVTSAVGLDSAPEAEREATVEANDRSFDRNRPAKAGDTEARDAETGDEPLVTPLAREDAASHGLAGLFGTLEAPEPLRAVTDTISLLDMPLLGGLHMLDPVTPLLDPLESIVHTAVPVVANVQPFANITDIAGLMSPAWHEPSHGASATPTATRSAIAAPTVSSDESRDALPAGHIDSTRTVVDRSPDASPDNNPVDPRGALRPSLLMTPAAGITALHAGAPGAAISADQAGPSGHALLPEEAVLRARLFSAAAYARTTGAKPQREANDPPVSPD